LAHGVSIALAQFQNGTPRFVVVEQPGLRTTHPGERQRQHQRFAWAVARRWKLAAHR